MTKYLITLALILMSITTHAQENETYIHQLKISPIRVFHMYNPGVELSYEIRHYDFSSQLTMGYMTDIFNATEYSRVRGFRLNFEEKFFAKKMRKVDFYVSAELGYNHLNIIKDQYDFFPYKIKRRSVIADAKCGWQFHYKHLVIDWGIGLGVKYQMVDHVGYVLPEDEAEFFDISGIYDGAGDDFVLNIPLTFKIGYRF